MAPICRDPGGRKRILVACPDGVRRAIFLGKIPEKMAVAVLIKVEALAAAKFTGGTVEDEVSRWVASLSDEMHRKLVRVGLVEPRAAVRSVTLVELIDLYCESRSRSAAGRTKKPHRALGAMPTPRRHVFPAGPACLRKAVDMAPELSVS